MSTGSPKVYVIKTPRSSRPAGPNASSAGDGEKRTRRSQTGTPRRRVTPRDSRRALTLAYLAGPVTISRWLNGRGGAVWSAAGFGVVLTSFILLVLRSRFEAWVETASFGLMWWLIIVPSLSLLTGSIWARSVAAAGRMFPVDPSRLPRRLYSPAVSALAGMVVPGLGLNLSGRPRLAGWTFLLAAPLVTAVIVLSRWQWLWDRGRSPVPAGVSPPTLEYVLVGTTLVVAVTAVLWLVQALDGARRASRRPSPVTANAASLALLASLAVFAVGFRPAKVAGNLHATASAFRADGYRLIPLGLNEAALRLDPAKPAYLAETVELYDAVGMHEKALERRRFLEEKANEYARFAFGQQQSSLGPEAGYRSQYAGNNQSPYHLLEKIDDDSPTR